MWEVSSSGPGRQSGYSIVFNYYIVSIDLLIICMFLVLMQILFHLYCILVSSYILDVSTEIMLWYSFYLIFATGPLGRLA